MNLIKLSSQKVFIYVELMFICAELGVANQYHNFIQHYWVHQQEVCSCGWQTTYYTSNWSTIFHFLQENPSSDHCIPREEATLTQSQAKQTSVSKREEKKTWCYTSSSWLLCRLQCDEHKGMPPTLCLPACLPPLTIQRESSARKKKGMPVT